jgi:Glycogen synthase
MRILYFSDTFLPEINGVTTVLATMRDGLQARGHEVRMVVPGYGTPSANETDCAESPACPVPATRRCGCPGPGGEASVAGPRASRLTWFTS